MGTLNEQLSQLLNDTKALPSEQWLEQMRNDHPFFALPLLMAMKRGAVHDEDTMQLLALMSADRKELAIALDRAPAAFAHFYGDTGNANDADSAIERFLNGGYGKPASQQEIDALEKAIFNPQPDYADILAAAHSQDSDTGEKSREDELISSFINRSRKTETEILSQQQPVAQHVQQQQVQQAVNDNIEQSTHSDVSMLSESLAKIYIARGKYSKALEIIESINLNFPEKSVYFADQIRFLRKLILNENLKTNYN